MGERSKCERKQQPVLVAIRLYYQYDSLRDGRRVIVEGVPRFDKSPELAIIPNFGVTGSQIWEALRDGEDVHRFAPYVRRAPHNFDLARDDPNEVYSMIPESNPKASECGRVDVKLVPFEILQETPLERGVIADSIRCDSEDTNLTSAWFGIGIVRGKAASNHGTLWRTALQLGAAFTFTIGQRYDKKVEGNADIFKTHRQMPCFRFEDIDSFMSAAPVDAIWVTVEYGGTSLTDFVHPKRAIYILGSEDNGVPPAMVQRAHRHVSIPVAAGRPSSLNVAAAGAIVLWDRQLKDAQKNGLPADHKKHGQAIAEIPRK